MNYSSLTRCWDLFLQKLIYKLVKKIVEKLRKAKNFFENKCIQKVMIDTGFQLKKAWIILQPLGSQLLLLLMRLCHKISKKKNNKYRQKPKLQIILRHHGAERI